MWDNDLAVLPGADVRRRLVEEWRRNPFLDEDIHLLEQRLGTPQAELRQAIDELCGAGILRPAGARGYMLDAGVASSPDPEAPAPAAEAAAEESAAYPAIDMSEGMAALFPGADVSAQALIESLPFGVVVLRASGALQMANQLAARWLGVPLGDLDGATFELATGVNPLDAAGGHPVSFSLHRPDAVEVSLYPATLASGDAVLAVLRDVSLQEEVSQLQGEVQEELYDRLNAEMVGPLTLIGQFLDHPDTLALSRARVAMEQVNGFLRDYFLRANSGTDPDENQPPCLL